MRDENKIKPHLMIFQWAQASGEDHKQIRDKLSDQPISTKQFVALSVHTNQQYIKYSETNTRRNRIWVRIPRVTRSILRQPWLQLLFSHFPCALPKNLQNSPPFFLSRSPLFACYSFFLLSLKTSNVCCPHFSLPFFLSFYICIHLSKLNLLKEIHFPFFYSPSFSEIRISLPFLWRTLSSHVCNHINPLFPPKIFFLPSLSALALVRVDQLPPILLSNDKK